MIASAALPFVPPHWSSVPSHRHSSRNLDQTNALHLINKIRDIALGLRRSLLHIPPRPRSANSATVRGDSSNFQIRVPVPLKL